MSLLSHLRKRGYPEDFHLNPFQVHRPDASELLPSSPGGVCQTENCDATATQIVSRHLRHKEVCRDCSDELTVLGGWEWVSRI